MVNNYKWAIGLSFLFTCFYSQALEVNASVSDNPAQLGESLDLIVTVDDSVSQNTFDFSVLEDDFRVLGTSVSSETRMINFETTRVTRFTTRLLPIQAGEFTIPAFTYKNAQSEPIKLTVEATKSGANTQNDDLFVETSISHQEVWLQQQVTYHCKLYIRRQISSGSLSEPKVPGALVEVAGKDKEGSEIKNGMRYRVIERTYLITPQRSGTFTIDSPVFQAEVIDSRRSQFFNQSKVVSRTGPSQTLTVKPVPQDYQGTWLPSEMVMLNDEIQPHQGVYQVGEPITRKITLSAFGVNPEQLPEIKPNYPDAIKVYPDQSESNSNQRDGQTIAQRIQSAALVPTQAGEYVLPEIKISWFNTKTSQQSFAVIPAQTIKVEGSALVTGPNSQHNPLSTEATHNGNCKCAEQFQPQAKPGQTQPNEAPSSWAFTKLSVLFLILWLVSLLVAGYLYLVYARQQQAPKSNKLVATDEEKKYWLALNRAIKAQDVHLIYQGLPLWVASIYNETKVKDFSTAVALLNDQNVKQEVARLQRNLYGHSKTTTDLSALESALTQCRDKILIARQQKDLKGLNPLNP
ncbi:BatD family protein [Gayadomonas joobiniege]|uniref:BatD family protein n=1 Tax=Gayadomonas joobiniege TaxID=1234606 RepID=UPI00036D6287|nr:BatD family protein [Gayadomonas joobiniege]